MIRSLFDNSFVLCRYFSSAPPPTEPAKLRIPRSKGDDFSSKTFDLNQQGSPAVLSPPGKVRRVMLSGSGSQFMDLDEN